MKPRKKFPSIFDLNELLSNFEINNEIKSNFVNKNVTKHEEGSDEFGKWVRQTISTSEGDIIITSYTNVFDDWVEPTPKNNIELLKKKLEVCVEEQNYEEAAKLRDQIKKIESNKEEIESLKKELDIVVKEQNFERAIEIRDQIKKMES